MRARIRLAAPPRVVGVGAILHTADQRFLLQLRDARPAVSMSNCWGLFGGVVERDETPLDAVKRELMEELAFSPTKPPTWFTEVFYSLGFARHGIHGKVFYALKVTEHAIGRMRLGEGQEMKLFTVQEIASRADVLPWDAFGILMFARRGAIRNKLRPKAAVRRTER